MRRFILLAVVAASALAATAAFLPGDTAPAEAMQSGQDRFVVFESFSREN